MKTETEIGQFVPIYATLKGRILTIHDIGSATPGIVDLTDKEAISLRDFLNQLELDTKEQ